MTAKFDIPDAMREFAEKSVDHARKAFEEFLGAAHQAVDSLETSAQTAQRNVRTLGEEAIRFAEENMAASFEFAQRLVQARNVEEMLRVQTDFVERQMAVLAEQARKLSSAGAAAAGKAGKARGD
ncbi:phasin [Tepidamorphus gemmatus]|jgi:phasin|uniref:Phasin n=1 Tax=Tepidamorphus gemmatus TaxID=747076 RepID=A0A4R3MEY9_9HYPH|nr:phasin family protein [Tepidamorphus gemmatus]TCT12061.1 phasin [Tepidamorphus gemmatus]